MNRTVFTNANLLDGEHPAKPQTTVIVEGNKIARVTSGAVETASGDRVVDLFGRTLMPGMTSGHFHTTYHDVGGNQLPFGLERPPAYAAYYGLMNAQIALRSGFTSVVGASCAFDVDASLAAAIRDGVVEGPRVCPASRDLITTSDSNDVIPWWWQAHGMGVVRVCDGADEFRKAVRDEIKRGAEIIQVYVTGGHGVTTPKHNISLTLDELHAVVDAAHGRGKRVRGHVAHKRAILDCITAGVDIIDHADGMDEECIEKLAAAGTFVLPSLYLPLKMLEYMGDAPPAGAMPEMGFNTETGQDFADMCRMLAKAVEAGVKLCVGDDFGAAPTPHGSYVEELAVYVDHAGIPPLEVLRWATKNGGELFGQPDKLGTVEEGKLADLVVVESDPSDNIGVLRDGVVAVMKDGKFFVDDLA
jgi:imidazolonepropionase-like amidohydrolase